MSSQKIAQIKNREDFGWLLNHKGLIRNAAEIGVFKGEFAEVMLKTWIGSKLYLVDPWQHLNDYLDSWNLSDGEMETNFQTVLEIIKPFHSRTQIKRMRGEQAVTEFDDNFFDFIYIDANHSYFSTKKDLELWYPKLRVGGIFAGHDYYDAEADADFEPIILNRNHCILKTSLTSYGVKSAVDEFAERINTGINVTQEVYPSWYFQKVYTAST